MKSEKNKKVFIDANYIYVTRQFLFAAPFFTLITVGIVSFILIVVRKVPNAGEKIFFLMLKIAILIPFIYFTIIFTYNIAHSLRWKGWFFKIETDNSGIYFNSLRKRIHISWNEVISISDTSKKNLFNVNVAEIKTQKGFFNIPTSMKEKEKKYPKINNILTSCVWVYENNVEEEVTLENCPLYIEMKKHLGNK